MSERFADLTSAISCSLDCLNGDTDINAIVTDSRMIKKGNLFVAIQGDSADGHDYIKAAVDNNCAAVILEHGHDDCKANLSVPFVEVADSRIALAQTASAFYQNPAEGMALIGITGTNGKTTTTYLLEAIVKEAGGNPGVIGTVDYRFNGLEFPAPFTTPEPVILYELLREMKEAGVTHVIMEVSSHSLTLKRIYGLLFDVALFTNLTRDHLDFHGNMEKYFSAKKMLFTDYLKGNGKVVIMRKSPGENSSEIDWGGRIFDDLMKRRLDESNDLLENQIYSCGFDGEKDVFIEQFSCKLDGTRAELFLPEGKVEVSTLLVGGYNLENIMGAAGVGAALGCSTGQIERGINNIRTIPGRLERVGMSDKVRVYVDYAHTPDALENVLNTLGQLCSARIIVVFGCGGDRDQGKRFLMGEVAGRLADLVVITSDNSRSESTNSIMAEIEKGVVKAGQGKIDSVESKLLLVNNGYQLIPSRSDAIKRAIGGADDGDVILIAGKGHEQYQITENGTHFFDDRQEAGMYMKNGENDF